jgi:hypothetical protein
MSRYVGRLSYGIPKLDFITCNHALYVEYQAFGTYAERYRSVQKYIKYSVKALKSLEKCVPMLVPVKQLHSLP